MLVVAVPYSAQDLRRQLQDAQTRAREDGQAREREIQVQAHSSCTHTRTYMSVAVKLAHGEIDSRRTDRL